MAYKVGDHIFYRGDFNSLEGWREGVVTHVRAATRHGQGLVWVDHAHKPEDCIIADYAWPIAVKDEVIAIITENARIRKELDDRMGLVYKLRNRCVNEGLC